MDCACGGGGFTRADGGDWALSIGGGGGRALGIGRDPITGRTDSGVGGKADAAWADCGCNCGPGPTGVGVGSSWTDALPGKPPPEKNAGGGAVDAAWGGRGGGASTARLSGAPDAGWEGDAGAHAENDALDDLAQGSSKRDWSQEMGAIDSIFGLGLGRDQPTRASNGTDALTQGILDQLGIVLASSPCAANPTPMVHPPGPVGCDKVDDSIAQYEAECAPPCLGCGECTEPDVSASTSLILEDADPTIAFGPDGRDLVNAAWNLLQQNQDLVWWINCLLWGQENTAGNLALDLQLTRQVIVADSGLGKWMHTNPVTGKIHIRVDSEDWNVVLEKFVAGPDLATQMCAVAEAAEGVFHELLHVAGHWGTQPGHATAKCDRVTSGGAALSWALAQRYPCVLTAVRCGYFWRDCEWMRGHGVECGYDPSPSVHPN